MKLLTDEVQKDLDGQIIEEREELDFELILRPSFSLL